MTEDLRPPMFWRPRFRRFLAVTLAVAMMGGARPAFGQTPAPGTLSGRADDEAKKPYSDYVVQLRDVNSGQVANTQPIDPQGQFVFLGAGVPGSYLIELVIIKDKKIVCTEGPYDLTRTFVKNDVDISCNKVPVAWWLLGVAAAAGITAGVVVANQSNTQ